VQTGKNTKGTFSMKLNKVGKQTEIGGEGPTWGETETVECAGPWRPLDLTIRTEVDYSPNPGHSFAGARSILVQRIHGIATKGSAAICRPTSTLRSELADMPRDESVARQCTPVGDPFDDKQWSNRLSSPLSDSARRTQSWGITNLYFREDDYEGARNITVGDP